MNKELSTDTSTYTRLQKLAVKDEPEAAKDDSPSTNSGEHPLYLGRKCLYHRELGIGYPVKDLG